MEGTAAGCVAWKPLYGAYAVRRMVMMTLMAVATPDGKTAGRRGRSTVRTGCFPNASQAPGTEAPRVPTASQTPSRRGPSAGGPGGTRKSPAALCRPLKQCLCMCRQPPWQGAAAAVMWVLLPLGRVTCCCRCSTHPLGHALLLPPPLPSVVVHSLACCDDPVQQHMCCCLYRANTASTPALTSTSRCCSCCRCAAQ